ncbi:MAG: hypothetical protein KA100_02600 [Rickettsiales bacterium]|nr:hypothetical protein [Rickettsiales bacterium]
MSDKVVTISAQIPFHLDQGLAIICAAEDRSKSFFIKKALEEFLREKLEDAQDYQDAKEAYEKFKKSKQKAIPYDKIKKKYKL